MSPAEIQPDDPLQPIPLVILSGFLGAGKTTRLNRWLKEPALADTLVIINEFGEVGLDHLLVEEAPGDVVLLAAGCLCCTMRGDLVATLEDLLRRRDNHRIRFFRQVLIETTGLADPLPILQSVLQHPYLSKRFAVAGLITLVDAAHGAETLTAHPEARRQVALADAILITKSDLASPKAPVALKAAVSDLNPTAPIIANEADFDANTLFSHRFAPRTEAAIEAWLGNADAATHGSDIDTFAFTSAEPIPEASLIVFQEAMRVLHGPRLLRLKGLIALKEDPDRPVVIHHVQSIAHRPERLPRWPGRDRRTRIVFITQGIPRETITRFWDALVAAAK
ncbi:MAG: GTP-binding protein [Rhizobiales bacterium PAR1]|nr:MAG: GTP-binding protein [Rhizobiales bacterium PAR1]